MSRVRKIKKHVDGDPAYVRYDRLYEKRAVTDPFFLVGQQLVGAPVKYSRCHHCVGDPHHAPTFFFATATVPGRGTHAPVEVGEA